MVPDMKKVNSREFQKKFSDLNKNLKPGQSVEITHHGKPMAIYTKRVPRRIKTPDFLSLLKNDPQVGDQILKKYYDSLS